MSQYHYMKSRLTKYATNRIAEGRRARGMSQQELAVAVGAHWVTISKLERGRIKLTTDWLERLAVPLGVQPRDLLARVKVFPLGFAEEEGPFRSKFGVSESRGAFSKRKGAFWVTIDGAAYEPLLHAGDSVELIPWKDLEKGQQMHPDGKLCFFEIKKNTGRFGFVYSGKKHGTYDIFWLGGRVIEGAKSASISLAATIRFSLTQYSQ
jgi:transcriptional regulator with XRE-family HTH domain